MQLSLAGKSALVTGGAAGIGKATVKLLTAAGVNVTATDIDTARLATLAGEQKDTPGSLTTTTCDVTSSVAVGDAVSRTVEQYGKLDILVNSAGITPRNLRPDADLEEKWRAVLEVNLLGTMLACHAASEVMVAHGGGSIINLASIMGVVAYHDSLGLSDGFNPYPQSKGGVVQLTRDMATSFAKKGVRVNAVCPGFVKTDLVAGVIADARKHEALAARHPMGRLGEPEEIASVICFLASDEAAFVTGAAWLADGGYTAC